MIIDGTEVFTSLQALNRGSALLDLPSRFFMARPDIRQGNSVTLIAWVCSDERIAEISRLWILL